MNQPLGQPFALGRTAELYAWDRGQVLKLYHNWFDLEDIQFEQRMAQAIHSSGLPVPRAGEIVQVNNRNGLIYERVDGASMWERLQRKPWRVACYAHQTAELHAEVHVNTLRPDIPSQRLRLERKINAADPLPAPEKQSVLAALASLPDGDSICHGDFHPGNILLPPGHAVVIDWIDASIGNPLADVARTTIIILGAAASSQVQNRVMKFFIKLLHSIYLRHYFHLRPGGEAEYRRWLPVVAAARLSESIPELESWLVKQVRT
jgi:uncharacterized protein (TIGR02172 family)